MRRFVRDLVHPRIHITVSRRNPLVAVNTNPKPPFPFDDPESLTREACSACRQTGNVYVTSFRWGGERHLSWSCRACGHAWAMAERRRQERAP